MRLNTLDQIVRNVLLSKRLSLHFYGELLTHAANCLRELTLDSLQVVNTVELTLNNYYAADLPCDMVPGGDVSVGFKSGQYVINIAQRDTINNLANVNGGGQRIPYGPPTLPEDGFNFLGWGAGWSWTWNIDTLGENTGRLFGATITPRDGYKIIPERGQIQFTETFVGCVAVLVYISDGQCIDNATQITPLAFNCISDWINWKRSANADVIQSPQGQTWVASRKVLRARLNPITPVDIRAIMRKHYKATAKN